MQLLPQWFRPGDLLGKAIPLLLEPHYNGLSLLSETQNQSLSNGFCDENGEVGQLKSVALEAANKSHAQYSGCPFGVAILDSMGKIYKGSYMESTTYNHSLGPLQAALVAYIARGGGGYVKLWLLF